jgi:hypothetical protein
MVEYVAPGSCDVEMVKSIPFGAGIIGEVQTLVVVPHRI